MGGQDADALHILCGEGESVSAKEHDWQTGETCEVLDAETAAWRRARIIGVSTHGVIVHVEGRAGPRELDGRSKLLRRRLDEPCPDLISSTAASKFPMPCATDDHGIIDAREIFRRKRAEAKGFI